MNFVSAQYVACEPPQPPMMIRAVADDGSIWWMTDDCTQGDWLRFIEEGGAVKAADEPETKPAP